MKTTRTKTLAFALGQTIRAMRIERHLSQEAFADLCKLHRTYIGAIERGEKNITLQTLSKVAQILNVQMSVIMAYTEKSLQDDV